MKRTIALFIVGISTLGVIGCSDAVPTPGYGQSRAIDQDIDATHAGMPSLASPTAANTDPSPSPLPWRNEEQMDQQKAEQTGQAPQ